MEKAKVTYTQEEKEYYGKIVKEIKIYVNKYKGNNEKIKSVLQGLFRREFLDESNEYKHILKLIVNKLKNNFTKVNKQQQQQEEKNKEKEVKQDTQELQEVNKPKEKLSFLYARKIKNINEIKNINNQDEENNKQEEINKVNKKAVKNRSSYKMDYKDINKKRKVNRINKVSQKKLKDLPKEEQLYKEKLIKQLQVLYVMSHERYLIQGYDGKYNWITNTKYKYIPRYMYERHVLGQATLGVFGYKYTTKFISIDIDMRGESKQVVEKIVNTYKNDFNIKDENILITFSGNKGYHVDIFFDEIIGYDKAQSIYDYVIYKNNLDKNLVEFRPTSKQGIKIPLGINQVTKRKCSIVNTELQELDDSNIFNVIKLSKEQVLNITRIVDEHIQNLREQELVKLKNNLPEQRIQEFSETLNKIESTSGVQDINIDIKLAEQLEHIERSKVYYEKGYIERPKSRHIDLMELLKYIHLIEGYKQEEALQKVIEIINTSYDKGYPLSRELTKEEVIGELVRISQYTITYDYIRYENEVYITKEEIEKILKLERVARQRVAYTMLIHGKRYCRTNGEFYISYKQLQDYGNGSNTRSLKRIIEEITSNTELIEFVESGGLRKGSRIPKSNKYKIVNNTPVVEDELKVYEIGIWEDIDELPTLEEVVKYFYEAEELRKIITPSMYRNSYRKMYVDGKERKVK